MADTEDDDWLEAVAGRPRQGTSKEILREAESIRRQLSAAAAQSEDQPDETDRELSRLLFRLKSERLIVAKQRWIADFPVASIAAVLVLAVAVAVLGPFEWQVWRQDDAGTVRGVHIDQVVEVADVDAAASEVAQLLRDHGVEAKTYPLGAYRGLNASVPPEQRKTLSPLLQRRGIRMPESGVLALEFRPATARPAN